MAELLESRLKRLKARLDGLRRLYTDKERPLAVDIEIEVIEEKIRNLGFGVSEDQQYH